MNKVYTIGRDSSCDIVIADTTDVVSRVHASLKVKGPGKYVLIDQSRNGTYVNGIRMSANEEIPVTREDIISFAHVQDLDWSQIPKGSNPKMAAIIIVIAVLVIGLVCFFIATSREDAVETTPMEETVPEVCPELPEKSDSVVRETIYVRPKPNVGNKPKREKPVEREEAPKQEEPEVVNPLL